jgi:diaminopimelate decarboxylase
MTDIGQWGLGREGPDLAWGGVDLVRLARDFGTPLYVVNAGRLRQAVSDFRQDFRSQGLEPELFYSVKTNPVPATVRVLAGLDVGAEVISGFELWLARRVGLDGSRVIVNASLRDAELLGQAVECGARMINVKAPAELLALRETAARAGREANVGLRINPGLRGGLFNLTTATGSAKSPIGLVRGSVEWHEALKILKSSPELRFRGLQFHVGSGVRCARPYREALRNAVRALKEVLATGLRPEVLDIGGGFSPPTVKEIGLLEALRLFAWNKPPSPPRPFPNGLLKEVAAACRDELRAFTGRTGCATPRVFIEPGRALTSSSQILLLGVDSVVARKKRCLTAFCDGGAMSLSQLLISEYHDVFAANRSETEPSETCDVFGSLPTSLDIVAFRRRLPRLRSGDVLAVMDTGAYFTSLGNNFAGARPGIVVIADGRAKLVRRRESYKDLVLRDIGGDGAPETERV